MDTAPIKLAKALPSEGAGALGRLGSPLLPKAPCRSVPGHGCQPVALYRAGGHALKIVPGFVVFAYVFEAEVVAVLNPAAGFGRRVEAFFTTARGLTGSLTLSRARLLPRLRLAQPFEGCFQSVIRATIHGSGSRQNCVEQDFTGYAK